MSFPKLLLIIGILLFGGIATASFFKEKKEVGSVSQEFAATAIEIDVDSQAGPLEVAVPKLEAEKNEDVFKDAEEEAVEELASSSEKKDEPLPEANRIEELFMKGPSKLPIVTTVTYKSHVEWLKGRPAWLSDYASHYKTSRHFIARSLNGKPDYLKQDIAEGAKFNVFAPEKNIGFHLVIDTSRCKMWFYYHDIDANEKVLLKTYQVGLGRPDKNKASGLLTPHGRYSLGSKVGIYKPGQKDYYNGEKTEMIKVFGTRWIPFEDEIADATEPAKGFGIHGNPWNIEKDGQLAEDASSLGMYKSDGCIRLATNDVEELFAIIITKPTTVWLVKDFYDAKLPGIEKTGPK